MDITETTPPNKWIYILVQDAEHAKYWSPTFPYITNSFDKICQKAGRYGGAAMIFRIKPDLLQSAQVFELGYNYFDKSLDGCEFFCSINSDMDNSLGAQCFLTHRAQHFTSDGEFDGIKCCGHHSIHCECYPNDGDSPQEYTGNIHTHIGFIPYDSCKDDDLPEDELIS